SVGESRSTQMTCVSAARSTCRRRSLSTSKAFSMVLSSRAVRQVKIYPLLTSGKPARGGAGKDGLHVELEQHHVAVLHHVFLALVAGLAGFARSRFAAKRGEVVIGDRLRTDESTLEIGMDYAGSLWSLGALQHCPGTRFLWTRSEERDQVQKLIAGMDETIE